MYRRYLGDIFRIYKHTLFRTPLSMMTIPGITETVIKEAEKYAKTEIVGRPDRREYARLALCPGS